MEHFVMYATMCLCPSLPLKCGEGDEDDIGWMIHLCTCKNIELPMPSCVTGLCGVEIQRMRYSSFGRAHDSIPWEEELPDEVTTWSLN